MIRHTVAFRLLHPAGSPEETDFTFGFSMEFADAAAYDAYNQHPAHIGFVQERWLPEVADFLELDYQPLV